MRTKGCDQSELEIARARIVITFLYQIIVRIKAGLKWAVNTKYSRIV